MHRIQNAAVNPRCYRLIMSPILRAGLTLQDKTIPCAVFLRWQRFLILPEELVLHHVFIGEVSSQQAVVPTLERQHAGGFLAGKYSLDGQLASYAHMQKKARPRGARSGDFA